MIVVVCLNPAVDVTYEIDSLVPGSSHRVTAQHERAGGKGVNVARVLHQLGRRAMLLGFVGGHRGAAVSAELEAAGLPARWTPVSGPTRQTVTVVDSDATVLLEPGPVASAENWAALVAGFEQTVAEGADLVVLAGSLPAGVPTDAYAQLIALAAARSTRTLLDTAGPALRAAVRAGPFLAKPNLVEAAALVPAALVPAAGTRGSAAVDAVLAAGARNAVVSEGAAGLVAALDGQRYRVRGPALFGNPTGAGDALTAALAAGITAGLPWPAVLRNAAAVAAGAVSVPYAGEFDPAIAEEFRALVTVEED